jgi:crotonobetainyl-CoA:carnitine CoA-transferase CaiB-like acyl-CoA transferase
MEQMLGHLRALDLTDENGFLAGKILADLGVNVIKVEKPGGDPSRNTGGFLGGRPDPSRSLYWYSYNSNKKGITLDIESARGKELFLELAAGADFIIESFPPGYMDGIGLGYETLSHRFPGLSGHPSRPSAPRPPTAVTRGRIS